ncbi:MAG: SRPBCC family protein [Gluconacetobacter diazotrophicus]|nr:SRPBCC family protein [Gluconacetobacter diazotrophicus]
MTLYRLIDRTAAIGLGMAVLAPDAGASAGTPHAGTVPTMQEDQVRRSPDIRWAPGFDPATADLFAHNELLIRAPCDTVFGHIADATRWPAWYANAAGIRILGGGTTLAPGNRFRWTTFGLHIESTVHEFEPGRRIGWYGSVPGRQPTFYHAWYLAPVPGGCLTIMEEVGKGADAAHLRSTDESLMHRGHDLWLAGLRWMSESRGG